MFGLKKKEGTLTVPAIGTVINITGVPDQVFSQKILGDGFAVIPSDGNILCPINGTVTEVAETLHAYGITGDDGLEVLVHIGLDTVMLRGEGFTPFVRKGDKIAKGAPLAFADLSAIKAKGCETHIICVITNTDIMKNFSVSEGIARSSDYNAMAYKL